MRDLNAAQRQAVLETTRPVPTSWWRKLCLSSPLVASAFDGTEPAIQLHRPPY
jgi:hypothetical protein